MNFDLTPEQQMLQDSVRRFVEGACAFESRQASISAGQAEARESWSRIAENGWLAAALPSEFGGLDGSALDTCLIAHEVGRGLVLDSYVGSGVLAPQAILAAGSDAQRAQYLPAIIDGTLKFALGYAELQTRGLPEGICTTARPVEDGYVLSGRKTQILGGVGADKFIVSAATRDGSSEQTLFLVDSGQPGSHLNVYPQHDGTFVTELVLDGCSIARHAMLGPEGAGLPALKHALVYATAALCAEMVGLMERATELTAEYLAVRKQFGVVIGQFQALQHRLADMTAEMEMARSMLYVLLSRVESGNPQEQQWALSQAKALIGRSAKYVCGQAIQLHGGIGMTEEFVVGHFYKRAVVANLLLGQSDTHDELRSKSISAICE